MILLIGLLYLCSTAKLLHCDVTMYCSIPKGSHWTAKQRIGTCAVDPKVIPYGKKVLIRGKWYLAMGKHGKRGRVVDIFMTSRHKCMQFGRQKLRVKVK